MARNVQAELEHEADKKGLSGERRASYIGGAWQRITQSAERRDAWRHSEEYRLLAATIGPVEGLRQPKNDPDRVYFRQGAKWYALPAKEYQALIKAAREEERERQKAAREYERGRKVYERELARAEKSEARERQLKEKRDQAEAAAQQRAVRAVERAEYQDVLNIIRRAGGIRRVRSAATGRERDKSEYDTLPRSVRQRRVLGFATARDRGLTLDEAATEVHQHMPWLKLETPDALIEFFGRHRDLDASRRYRGGLSLAA